MMEGCELFLEVLRSVLESALAQYERKDPVLLNSNHTRVIMRKNGNSYKTFYNKLLKSPINFMKRPAPAVGKYSGTKFFLTSGYNQCCSAAKESQRL